MIGSLFHVKQKIVLTMDHDLNCIFLDTTSVSEKEFQDLVSLINRANNIFKANSWITFITGIF
jgi:hypothetical protein